MPTSTTPNVVQETALAFVDLSLLDNGILVYRYHAEIELDMPKVVEMEKIALKMTGGQIAPILSILGDQMTVAKAVLEYGKTPEATKMTNASAIVLESLAHRILGNFFVRSRLRKSSVPFKIFNDEATAIEWLLQQPA